MTVVTLLNGPFGTWHSALNVWQLLAAAALFVLPTIAYFVIEAQKVKHPKRRK